MQQIGLKLWSTNTDCYLSEAQRLYKNRIFDYIELYVVPDSLDRLQQWEALTVPYIIHCPHFAHGFNLAQKECREKNLRIYAEVKRYADALQVPCIIFHGGIDGTAEETAHQLASLQEPRALIENKPMKALPNRMGGNFCRGYNLEEIALIRQVSGCGFCLDVGHALCSANSQNIDPYTYVKDFFGLEPAMVHLSDVKDIHSEYDTHLHLGAGELDLRRIIRLLPKRCPVSLETVKSFKDSLNDFVKDVQTFRDIALPFRLRTAQMTDIESVFKLSNDAQVRQNSIHREAISWASHQEWYAARLHKPQSPFLIAEHKDTGAFMGQVRFDLQEGGESLISISLVPEWRSRGISTDIIRQAIRFSESSPIVAWIRAENIPSIHAFERAGFVRSGQQDGLIIYKITQTV